MKRKSRGKETRSSLNIQATSTTKQRGPVTTSGASSRSIDITLRQILSHGHSFDSSKGRGDSQTVIGMGKVIKGSQSSYGFRVDERADSKNAGSVLEMGLNERCILTISR